MHSITSVPAFDPIGLAARIKAWGGDLGFQAIAIADVDVVSLDPNGTLQELPESLSAIWTAGAGGSVA